MKFLLLLIPAFLVGCRTAPPLTLPQPGTALAAPTPTVVALPAPATSGTAVLEQKIRQQAQVIEALISQNDALTAKLATVGETVAPVVAATVPPSTPPAPLPAPLAPMPTVVAPASPVPLIPPEPTLTPNADGVIDLTATSASKPGEPVNPFAVRVPVSDGVREVTLHVGGIIAGPTACAVVNDRLVQSGDLVESLSVERIESDAVFLRREGQRMRVPVSAQPIRVRMPL